MSGVHTDFLKFLHKIFTLRNAKSAARPLFMKQEQDFIAFLTMDLLERTFEAWFEQNSRLQ